MLAKNGTVYLTDGHDVNAFSTKNINSFLRDVCVSKKLDGDYYLTS